MKRTIGVFLFFTATLPLAGACASRGSDVDSESHFQCGEDGDCKNAHGRSICVSGWCEVPGIRQTVLNEVSGPAVDCMTEWPATTLRFETAKIDDTGAGFDELGGPRLNRNGTAVFSMNARDGGGKLLRWAGDTVSLFEQPEGDVMLPAAVSCDGLAVVGLNRATRSAYRWSATDGFAALPVVNELPAKGMYRPMAISSDGSTVWGSYRFTTDPFTDNFSAGIRWTNDLAESLFTVDAAATASPGWSGDASVFIGYTANDLFAQNAGAAPTYLETTLEGELPTAVSFDGSVIGGYTKKPSFRGYLRSFQNQLEYLPEAAVVLATTPGGVAVGFTHMQGTLDVDFVWDRKHGARHLRDVLATHGLQLPSDMMLGPCEGISTDGRVIIGTGSDREASYLFRAILPAGAFD